MSNAHPQLVRLEVRDVPATFAVIGDYGVQNQAEADIANLVKSWNPDFVITAGDNAYNASSNNIDPAIGKYYQQYIGGYAGAFGAGAGAANKFFPSVGNHDWDGVASGLPTPYTDYFALPGNERYYDFVRGGVHFFALSSDPREPDGVTFDSVQGKWFQDRIAASTAAWQVAYFHHPSYSSSSVHGSTPWMQWPFQTLGVDAVIAGHDHTYERIMRDDTANGIDDPIPYLVNGLGGAGRYAFGPQVAGSTARYNDDHGAQRVTSSPTSLKFEFVNRAGAVIDTYTIRAAEPVAVGGVANDTARPLAPAGGQYAAGAPLTFFPGQGGNVRTATADVTGDGNPDYVGGTGPGGASRLAVLDGKTGATVTSFAPFEPSFTGGVFVTAADLDGDGQAEVVVSPDQGGGPLAAVYSGAKLASGLTGDAAQLLRYFAIDDKTFFGGARPALGDITGDGKAELIASAGFLGGPRITVWDGASILAGAPTQLLNFFAFENTLRNGAFVAAGDTNGDGKADLAFGGGPGSAPRVRLFDGARLLAAGGFQKLDDVEGSSQVANFFAGGDAPRGGVRLALKDVTADGKADLVAGSGEGEPSRVRVYLATTLPAIATATPAADQELDPFGATLPNGVFVG